MTERKNILLDKSLQLSLDIIEYTELLETEHKYVIARQLMRSGTSIGANIHEAQHSESPLDFVHKLKNCGKRSGRDILLDKIMFDVKKLSGLH